MSPWLISSRVDIALLTAPGCIAVLIACVLPLNMDAPWWVYLFGVLLVDVAHVYSTVSEHI